MKHKIIKGEYEMEEFLSDGIYSKKGGETKPS
jgi:hypothetical protein